ncbi:MAG: UDP-3-O-(3-hydroxymyristoyl)glucosamine N-acyltransferase [Planctomycetaceae bacterium]|nr:UDP-3-O-(3-hydroxymyristoyl)glucosamine N-acyltransferase [Planctomycetaceae bacterium]
MRSQTATSLAELVQAEVSGNADLPIADGQALADAGPEHISFVAHKRNLEELAVSRAGAVVISRSLYEADARIAAAAGDRTVLLVQDALQAFLKMLNVLRPQPARREPGISHSAHVHPSAEISKGTVVYPGAHIAEDTQLGEDCIIHPNVVIGSGCRLGAGVVLFPGVVLYPGCQLGNQVIVHSGTVIGSDGFGYRLIDGGHRKLPHFGIVRIEDDVEIGSCVTIDRAMIGETVIGRGSRLDNLVHIAHNCQLGEHNLIMASAAIAGSVRTGDYLTCAGQVGMADHIQIGDRVTIGPQSGIVRDIADGETVVGTPGEPAMDTRRIWRTQRKLPEMWKTVRELQNRISSLESALAAATGEQGPALNSSSATSDDSRPEDGPYRAASSPAA